ncbi:MAG: ABC transporter substrate-binding protein [Coxiella sp. (in: Bacteria)]|nr:MAG: ABC transporter substrate-binding protein [Coxiella sp. (in: g-proteobacteria)]
MHFLTHMKEAFLNLIHAKMRSFLAILGILVGTGSVVALISSSQLATLHALAQFKSLGTNLLAMDLMRPYKPQSTAGGDAAHFMLSDLPSVLKAAPQVRLAGPYINLFDPINFKGKIYRGQVMGATRDLQTIAKMGVARGRFISYLDVNSYYCTIGSTLAKQIRAQGYDPMGRQIMIGNVYFTIVGVLKKWQPNLFIYANLNSGVVIPLATSYLLSKQAEIRNILFRLVKNPNLPKAQAAIKSQINLLLPSMQVQFRNPQQIINIVGKQRKTFTWLLGSIGGISLLVGGIGVMNIMLVSVVERRREIGIRMAIGARRSDVLMMFLIESIILTIFGGIVGIILGVLVSFGIAEASQWGFQVFGMPIVLGFAVSVLVGILSGIYPAMRASKLDPIQSLGAE